MPARLALSIAVVSGLVGVMAAAVLIVDRESALHVTVLSVLMFNAGQWYANWTFSR